MGCGCVAECIISKWHMEIVLGIFNFESLNGDGPSRVRGNVDLTQ